MQEILNQYAGNVTEKVKTLAKDTAVELTKKIQSIPAFHGVKAPMTRRKQGWIPDFSSRYFTEDVPLGTKPICCLAEQLNIPVPTLQTFVEWNTSILNRFSPFQKKQ